MAGGAVTGSGSGSWACGAVAPTLHRAGSTRVLRRVDVTGPAAHGPVPWRPGSGSRSARAFGTALVMSCHRPTRAGLAGCAGSRPSFRPCAALSRSSTSTAGSCAARSRSIGARPSSWTGPEASRASPAGSGSIRCGRRGGSRRRASAAAADLGACGTARPAASPMAILTGSSPALDCPDTRPNRTPLPSHRRIAQLAGRRTPSVSLAPQPSPISTIERLGPSGHAPICPSLP